MRKVDEGDREAGGSPPFAGSPLDPLADDEAWLDLLREAVEPRPAGSLAGYEILEEIRSGGQGLVFRARNPRTGRDVALKRLAAGAFSTAAMRRRFEREIEAVAALHHPGIVGVLDVELVDDVPVLAMEWVEGETLTEWAAQQPDGAAGVRAKLETFLRVCDAVQHAHTSGVLHRDLKPSNVLVDAGGACRVLDFGLARRVTEEGEDPTRTLGFLGTPAYAAPEHFVEGEAPLDVRSDVWSLGVVLYEMLTGRRPFEEPRLRELIAAIEERDPPRPSALVAGPGHELDTIVLKALAKSRVERYQTVHALAEDVRRHLAGQPVLAMPPSAGYELAKWIRRNRVVFGFSVALALLLVASAALGFWQASVIAAERDDTEAQRRLAEDARQDAETALGVARSRELEASHARDDLAVALERAQSETERARAVLEFFERSIVSAPTMFGQGADARVGDVLEHVAATAHDAFPDHRDTASDVRASVLRALMHVGRLDAAERLAGELLAETEGRDSPSARECRAVALLALAGLDYSEARFEEARARYEHAREVCERLVPARPSLVSESISGLGTVAQALGDAREAERLYRESLALTEASGSASALDVLQTEAAVGFAMLQQGRHAEAEAYLKDLLVRCEEETGGEGVATGRVLGLLGHIYLLDSRLDEALPVLRRHVALLEKTLGPDHPDLGYARIHLGKALQGLGQHAEAAEVFAAGARAGRDLPDIHAIALIMQGHELLALGENEAAREVLEAGYAGTGDLLPADPNRVYGPIELLSALLMLEEWKNASEVLDATLERLPAFAATGVPLDLGTLRTLHRQSAAILRQEDADEALAAMLDVYAAGPLREDPLFPALEAVVLELIESAPEAGE